MRLFGVWLLGAPLTGFLCVGALASPTENELEACEKMRDAVQQGCEQTNLRDGGRVNCSEEAQRAYDRCVADVVTSHSTPLHRARMEAERTARATAIAQNFIAAVVAGESEKLSQLGSPAFVREWTQSVAEKRVDTAQWASLMKTGARKVSAGQWEIVHQSEDEQVVVIVEEGGGISRVIAVRQ